MKRYNDISRKARIAEALKGDWVRYDDVPAWRTVGEHGMPSPLHLNVVVFASGEPTRLVYSGRMGKGRDAWVYNHERVGPRPGDRYIPLSELLRLPGGDS